METLALGTKIENWIISRELGRGGMGIVYLADHATMRDSRRGGLQAAIKVLHRHLTSDKTTVKRFHDEAVAAAAIKHPCIVEIKGSGTLADGLPYIVMEYLEGQTLAAYCRSARRAFTVQETGELLGPVASVLNEAHKRGIYHRDLKPENIFLVETPDHARVPKILDWGISKMIDREGGPLTLAGVVSGTPTYMAPEQLRSLAAADARADVYSLATIAYELLTGGYLPYQRAQSIDQYRSLNTGDMAILCATTTAVDPREHVPALDEALARMLLAAVHPDPAFRPQTPGELMRKLGMLEVLRGVAPGLLRVGNLAETVRAPAGVTSSKYQLGERLGAGGMAEVFRATQLNAEGANREVAIKRVLSAHCNGKDDASKAFNDSFVKEAQLAAKLSHGNVVSIIDCDRDPEGRLFLALELVEGCDLSKLIETGLLPHDVIIYIVTETLRGLGYAHNLPIPAARRGDAIRGLVHRDVSPHNVLLSWEGDVKVSDFGIAKARTSAEASASLQLRGKPRYMSPEQVRGDALDGRSDLFAVGIMLYEMLTGRPMFGGFDADAILRQVMFYREPPLPSAEQPGVPRELEAITLRLLAADREQRYPTAEAAIADLTSIHGLSPTNGRQLLVDLLAARFVQAAERRPSPAPSQVVPPALHELVLPTHGSPTGTDNAKAVTVRAIPYAAPYTEPRPTTLNSAASSALSASVPAKPSRALTAGLSAVLAAFVLVGGGTLLYRRHGTSHELDEAQTQIRAASRPDVSNQAGVSPTEAATAPAGANTAPATMPKNLAPSPSGSADTASLVPILHSQPEETHASTTESLRAALSRRASSGAASSGATAHASVPSPAAGRGAPSARPATPPPATPSSTQTPKRHDPDDVGGD